MHCVTLFAMQHHEEIAEGFRVETLPAPSQFGHSRTPLPLPHSSQKRYWQTSEAEAEALTKGFITLPRLASIFM